MGVQRLMVRRWKRTKIKEGGKGLMFKEIPNFSGYLINEKGVVINQRTRKRLTPNNSGKGYMQVQFRDKKNYFVHRLVAITFIPNPENKPCVDHIDGDKGNNQADNLRWVTVSENYYSHGFEQRRKSMQKAVMAENVVSGEVVNFVSRNACANYFKCDKSKIKYGWIYNKGTKKDWIFSLTDTD